MQHIMAIVLRELIILKRKFWRLFFSFTVSPLLFLVTFGWAGRERFAVDGADYSAFMLPGLIAMSAMINSFALAVEINTARFYWKTFDEVRTAPVADWAYVAGEVLSGMVRGLLAACIVLAIGLAFRVPIAVTPALLGGILLTTFVFASLAISAAMLAKSHADQGMLTSFIITPMAFLCGTFFPVDVYPGWLQALIHALPLTPASHVIRAAALHAPVPPGAALYLCIFGTLSLLAAIAVVRTARD